MLLRDRATVGDFEGDTIDTKGIDTLVFTLREDILNAFSDGLYEGRITSKPSNQ